MKTLLKLLCLSSALAVPSLVGAELAGLPVPAAFDAFDALSAFVVAFVALIAFSDYTRGSRTRPLPAVRRVAGAARSANPLAA